MAIEFSEECKRLLDLLKNPKLRQVALCKLGVFTNEEIADKPGCVLRTVERKLHAIREIWQKECRA
jgi:DNA-directed RNA polymerase specialized sigma24 family protein